MAGSLPTEFPPLDDASLPSTPEDKELLEQLKLAWDQYSDNWDEETKREFIDLIIRGYTKVTKSNQAQPSNHRLWKVSHMTFAIWIIFRVTYDEEKLSKPREWLRAKYKDIDPQSWVSPAYKDQAKPHGIKGETGVSSSQSPGPRGKSQASKSPQSIEPMEICANESDNDEIHCDGTYKDQDYDRRDQSETNGKTITRSTFKAINVPEPSRDILRKRGTSDASVNHRAKLQKTGSLRTQSSAEAAHLLEASDQPASPTVDSQVRSRPLKGKTELHELRDPGRGLHQRQRARSREPTSPLNASVISHEKKAPHVSSDSFMLSSSSEKKQPHTGETLPLHLVNRETLESPGDVLTQQTSSAQQLPLDDPDEPSWFRQFRRQYSSDQKGMYERITNGITKNLIGLDSKAVQGPIESTSSSTMQRAETMANQHTHAIGRSENADLSGAAILDLREMKTALEEIAATNRELLEAFRKERAEFQAAAYHHGAPGGYK